MKGLDSKYHLFSKAESPLLEPNMKQVNSHFLRKVKVFGYLTLLTCIHLKMFHYFQQIVKNTQRVPLEETMNSLSGKTKRDTSFTRMEVPP